LTFSLKDDEVLPALCVPSSQEREHSLSPSPSQPKMLKSILKNKSDNSIGDKPLKFDTKLSVRRDSAGEEGEKEQTPDVAVTANEQQTSKIEEFVSVRGPEPEIGYNNHYIVV